MGNQIIIIPPDGQGGGHGTGGNRPPRRRKNRADKRAETDKEKKKKEGEKKKALQKRVFLVIGFWALPFIGMLSVFAFYGWGQGLIKLLELAGNLAKTLSQP